MTVGWTLSTELVTGVSRGRYSSLLRQAGAPLCMGCRRKGVSRGLSSATSAFRLRIAVSKATVGEIGLFERVG